jgi:hypothetical protein
MRYAMHAGCRTLPAGGGACVYLDAPVYIWVTVGAHFLIALWLYMFSKILKTQKKSYSRSVAAVLLGLLDAALVALMLLMINSFTT